MNSKIIKNKLKNGEVTIGSWMQLNSADVAEVMGQAGYDWIVADMEHGSYSFADLNNIFRAIELGNTVPMVRIAELSEENIKRSLEAGAKGILVPMVKTASDVVKGIDWCKFPPAGKRSVGYSRACLFGKRFKQYFDNNNESVMFIPLIEHLDAVNNLDEILAVPGIDAIIVGPYDLSASLGVTGNFQDLKFVEAMKLIHRKAKENNVPMGLHIVETSDNKELKIKITDGYQFLAYGTDALFLISKANCPDVTS